MPTTVLTSTGIAYYDDRGHNYEDFWHGRDYEHLAEIMALRTLLGNTCYGTALDLGGGYGRIALRLKPYTHELYLVDPSAKQLDLARQKLSQYDSVHFVLMDNESQIPAADSSIDLLIMIRVSHHLPQPETTFHEVERVLRPGGRAVIEIANHAHFLNKLRYWSRGNRVPRATIAIGNHANGIKDHTPFVNHHPDTIRTLLHEANLQVIDCLSVSNLRHRLFKDLLPTSLLLAAERFCQRALARFYFGPSIFFLVEKQLSEQAATQQ